MKRLFRKRRGVSNIIATLIIFTVMIAALSLAFSQIIPTLERFQTQSDLTLATNTFLNFNSAITRLINSPDNSSSVVRYNLPSGELNLKAGSSISLLVLSNGDEIFSTSITKGELIFTLYGNYRSQGGPVYDIGDPTLLSYSTNNTESMTNIVRQTFDNYKELKLFYNVFATIEETSVFDIVVNFFVLELDTILKSDGINEISEYFPIINSQTNVKIQKASQELEESQTFELINGDLSIGAQTSNYFQEEQYEPRSSTFGLTVNIYTIKILFSTI